SAATPCWATPTGIFTAPLSCLSPLLPAPAIEIICRLPSRPAAAAYPPSPPRCRGAPALVPAPADCHRAPPLLRHDCGQDLAMLAEDQPRQPLPSAASRSRRAARHSAGGR